jgi:hypothetical protein
VFRRVLSVGSMFSLVTGMLTLSAMPVHASTSADASASTLPSVVVRIPGSPIRIGTDGSVPLAVRVRCDAGLNAFEFDASIHQGSTIGSATVFGPNLTPCDGRWHTLQVPVFAENGSFVPGVATVDVFLGAFDPIEGDLDATDAGTVRLR